MIVNPQNKSPTRLRVRVFEPSVVQPSVNRCTRWRFGLVLVKLRGT